MIKTIVQNDQSQKNGEIGEILRRPEEEEKKSRFRAFARTQAKNDFIRSKNIFKKIKTKK